MRRSFNYLTDLLLNGLQRVLYWKVLHTWHYENRSMASRVFMGSDVHVSIMSQHKERALEIRH